LGCFDLGGCSARILDFLGVKVVLSGAAAIARKDILGAYYSSDWPMGCIMMGAAAAASDSLVGAVAQMILPTV